MLEEKTECDGVGLDIEAPGVSRGPIVMPNLPKPLTLEEKKYLLAVERGDLPNVRRLLQRATRRQNLNINCLDPLGRGALTLAIDGENLEMVELLVVMGVETRDALLHAINAEFVEAVELLLEHEELIHKEGEPYSWQKVDWNTGTFTPDITPLILAAHRNNYEIIKILLDRGATLPMPHDVKCGCEECLRNSQQDSLRHSMSRVNEYRALASPSLIALSSNDPILTAFQLSWELRNLAFAEQECKAEYMELRRQCQQFAVDLLHQSRSSQELAIILNHDPDSPPYEHGEHMKLARLELAINYKQKKFVAHPNIQQLLAAIWYEGVPGFRRKPMLDKCMEISRVALLFPFYCMLYMITPNTATGKLMRKPFMKFLIHASAYLFFLLILILVSQRAEIQAIQMFGTAAMRARLAEQLLRQRGNGPSYLEWIVVVYVLGFVWEETHEIYVEGMRSYLRNMWNFIDFTRNTLYLAVAVLRLVAYIQQVGEINRDPATAYIPREQWTDFDPQLIAEGLFAGANVFSALKLVHLFSINPHLGPLQISLGRMVIDIVKFFFIYSLVLFAFACGLNQLLWYFAELERRKCYHLEGGLPDWDNRGDSCSKWRSFGNLFESSQSLFWASFGGIGTDNFELAGIKTYTRFWGLLMFGSYSVINVIVLLNLLIAMMSNSYAMITEQSDTEWKFARTRLWMSYFEESATLPPPFNIFPTPKLIMKLLGLRKKDKMRRMSTKRQERHEKERDYRYTAVMRAVVWRYVTATHRQGEENPVTEDDINEVKMEVSAMKCEVLEVLARNGMDVSSANVTEKTILGKKMRVWERRLMKDFHVAPVAAEEELDQIISEPPPENEDSLAKFRRIAKLALLNSTSHKWGQVVRGVCAASQIGHCNKRDSFVNQQNLKKAMNEARKLSMQTTMTNGRSRSVTPNIPLPDSGSSIVELLKDIENDLADASKTKKPPNGGQGNGFLDVASCSSQLMKKSPGMSSMRTITMQAAPSATAAAKSGIAEGHTAESNAVKQVQCDVSQASAKKLEKEAAGQGETRHPEDSTRSIAPCVPEESRPPTRDVDLNAAASSSSSHSSPSISRGGAVADPSPLLPQRKIVGGESPPKVFKKKAPLPVTDLLVPTADSNEMTETCANSTSPPCVPAPRQSPSAASQQEIKTAVDQGGSARPRPVAAESSATLPAAGDTEAVPKFEITLSQTQNSNDAGGMATGTSTEHLIPSSQSPSPAPLRAGKRIDDVNTIKRQPKAGWL